MDTKARSDAGEWYRRFAEENGIRILPAVVDDVSAPTLRAYIAEMRQAADALDKRASALRQEASALTRRLPETHV